MDRKKEDTPVDLGIRRSPHYCRGLRTLYLSHYTTCFSREEKRKPSEGLALGLLLYEILRKDRHHYERAYDRDKHHKLDTCRANGVRNDMLDLHVSLHNLGVSLHPMFPTRKKRDAM